MLTTLPGPDGVVRAVKLKTKSGELTRPVVKLCLLEKQEEPEVSDYSENRAPYVSDGNLLTH